MGRREHYGSFDDFVKKVSTASLRFRGLRVDYESPSVGTVSAAWRGLLKVSVADCPTAGNPRYDNQACHAEFSTDRIDIEYR